MNYIVFGIVLALLAYKGIASPEASTQLIGGSYDELYRKYGQAVGIDWQLIKAVAIVESGENPKAFNPNDPSYGLMQIVYPATRNIDDWPPENANKLYDPDYNIKVGSRILAWGIQKYGISRGIAVFNRYASRLDPPEGPFGNQAYVDKVFRVYTQLGGRGGLE